MKSDQPLGRGHVDAAAPAGSPGRSARAAAYSARSLGGQLDADPHRLVVGQVGARQLDDVLAVDRGAHQGLQLGLAAVGALGGGGQPQPEGRQAQPRRQRVGGAGQVVALVEHQQAEAAAQVLHVQVGRVVGGDGDRLRRRIRRRPPGRCGRRTWPRSPSCHCRTRSSVGVTTRVLRWRSSIASWATRVLPAPVGSTTTPRPPCLLPGGQRLALVGPRLAAHQHRPLQLLVPARLVLVADPAPDQRAHDVGVGRGRRPVAGRPRIPGARRAAGTPPRGGSPRISSVPARNPS